MENIEGPATLFPAESVIKLVKQMSDYKTQVDLLTRELEKTEKAKNNAYSERNRLAIALTKMAHEFGLVAGRGIDNNQGNSGWQNVVYVEFPNGVQVSWHMSPDEIPLLDILPEFPGKWDGTFVGRDPEWVRKMLAVNSRR